MREEIILRLIFLWFSLNYVIAYFKAKSEEHLVKVPKYISILFGAPVGIGIMPEFIFLFNSANFISLIIGILVYFFIDKTLGGFTYAITFVTLFLIVTLYDAIKYKD
ncbi:MAG: hypothetical protein AB6733_01275 [Clostridiaceae bacterium]